MSNPKNPPTIIWDKICKDLMLKGGDIVKANITWALFFVFIFHNAPRNLIVGMHLDFDFDSSNWIFNLLKCVLMRLVIIFLKLDRALPLAYSKKYIFTN